MDSHAIDLKRKYLSKLASPDHKTQKIKHKKYPKKKRNRSIKNYEHKYEMGKER